MIGMTDTAFLGRVGEIELGASAIAGVYYLAIFMMAFGFRRIDKDSRSMRIHTLTDSLYVGWQIFFRQRNQNRFGLRCQHKDVYKRQGYHNT